jgi:DNA-binding transcriptional ArsR family regulator
VDSLSRTLAAVADPTRRMILRRLAGGPASVSDLARPLPITQQAVSKHLACLERARLVQKQRDGRIHLCSLEAGPIREVAEWAAEYRRFWEESFDRLDAFLDQLRAEETPHESQD